MLRGPHILVSILFSFALCPKSISQVFSHDSDTHLTKIIFSPYSLNLAAVPSSGMDDMTKRLYSFRYISEGASSTHFCEGYYTGTGDTLYLTSKNYGEKDFKISTYTISGIMGTTISFHNKTGESVGHVPVYVYYRNFNRNSVAFINSPESTLHLNDGRVDSIKIYNVVLPISGKWQPDSAGKLHYVYTYYNSYGIRLPFEERVDSLAEFKNEKFIVLNDTIIYPYDREKFGSIYLKKQRR